VVLYIGGSQVKVLMITPYTKPVLGGISTYIDGLCRGMREHGVDCAVVAEKGRTTSGTTRTDRSLLRFVAEGILAILHFRPNVVHIHSNWRGFLIALPCSWLSRKSTLFFTFHTDSLSPLAGFRKDVFEAMLSRCDSLVFTSSYLQSATKESLSTRTKSSVILGGVSKPTLDEKRTQELTDKLHIRDRFPILLYMAPLVWEEKTSNIDVLGRILEDLRINGQNPVLVVVGEGPLRPEAEMRVRGNGLDGVVVFAGRVDNPGIALDMCDVYIHISKKESLSLAILEAMASGKPVIATRVGGTSEILSQKGVGLLVSEDLSDVKTALLALTSDPARMKDMGRTSREWVEENFTWKLSAGNHIKLYQEALDAD
jgi:glycosyltransferase involved in cell wall biosynthesis